VIISDTTKPAAPKSHKLCKYFNTAKKKTPQYKRQKALKTTCFQGFLSFYTDLSRFFFGRSPSMSDFGFDISEKPKFDIRNPRYTEGSLFQVINLLGQQVLVGKTTQQLDVSALPQGSYLLKVGTEVAKFVKQ
jgi:hypothetical protein